MASVAMQAAVSSAVLKSSFLGSTARLGKPVRAVAGAVAPGQLKVESKGAWLPGLASPAYLTGSLPGDNGFDPLGLGEDPENLKWYVQAELQNGRWAMLGVAGVIAPELLTKIGVWDAPVWYDAGSVEYFAPKSALTWVEFLLFHFVEVRRYQDIRYPGSVNQDPIFTNNKLPAGEVGYPGGIFNFLGYAANMQSKEKEIANGRLAMLAFLGFIVQSKVTGAGPVENLFAHLSDPWHVTIVQSLAK